MNSLNKKTMRDQAKRAALEDVYECLPDMIDQAGEHMVVAMIAVFERRGLTPKYIRKFFEDLIFFLDTPEIMGIELYSNEIQKRFASEYGIDFSRVHINMVSKEEFVKENM